MNRIRQLLDDAARYYGQLTKRERLLLGLMAGTAAFLALFISTSVVRSSIDRHQSSIEEKEGQLKLVAAYATTFNESERSRKDLEARLGGAPLKLMTHMQELADKHGLTIGSMNDRGDTTTDQVKESLVELQIASAPIEKLSPLLEEIERNPRIVKVKKLRLRKGTGDDKSVNVTMTVATYSLEKKG
jgi:hypothetical protein